jgi:uncharacterized protein
MDLTAETGREDGWREIVTQQSHRQFPAPSGRWLMTQIWNDLLFAHWRVKADQLRAQVPAGFEIDVFEKEAWLSITPFRVTDAAVRLLPAVPYVSSFPEVNVRTYVRVDGTPGVYFFSLDADSLSAVTFARSMFHLPYHWADIEVEASNESIRFASRRRDTSAPPAEWASQYSAAGRPVQPAPGSLEYFLTERYCLFTVDDTFVARRVDVHHAPWALQPAAADIRVNTMADAAGLTVRDAAPVLHFAKRQDVLIWPITRVA